MYLFWNHNVGHSHKSSWVPFKTTSPEHESLSERRRANKLHLQSRKTVILVHPDSCKPERFSLGVQMWSIDCCEGACVPPFAREQRYYTWRGNDGRETGVSCQCWCVFLCLFYRFAYPGKPWVFLNAGGAGYWRHTRPILDRSVELEKEEMGDDVLLISNFQRQEITFSTHVRTKKSDRIDLVYHAYFESRFDTFLGIIWNWSLLFQCPFSTKGNLQKFLNIFFIEKNSEGLYICIHKKLKKWGFGLNAHYNCSSYETNTDTILSQKLTFISFLKFTRRSKEIFCKNPNLYFQSWKNKPEYVDLLRIRWNKCPISASTFVSFFKYKMNFGRLEIETIIRKLTQKTDNIWNHIQGVISNYMRQNSIGN